jgi:hypothetical protein
LEVEVLLVSRNPGVPDQHRTDPPVGLFRCRWGSLTNSRHAGQ